jgi:hypothetical protein
VVPEPSPVLDRDGVRPDGAERDGVRPDGAERDGMAVAGVEHAARGLGVRVPATRAAAALDEVALDRMWEVADARQVTPVGRGAPQHGVWEAIRSRAGRRSVSCCEPIGEPCGR